MNAFTYYNPVRVVFGEDSLSELGRLTAAYGQRAVLVSYTDISFYGDLFDRLHRSLEAEGVEWRDFLGVTANPTIGQAEQGIALCREFHAQVIIGVGGGSAMDCAKVIAAGVPYPYELTRMILFSHADGSQIPPKTALPLLQIPTLPATGSEMNATAVITDEASKRKSYVWADCLYAKAALVDPSLSRTLPFYQTACGALDTIAHTAESYFNGAPDTNLDVQDRLQEGLIRTVLDNFPRVKAQPDSTDLRGVMQWASAIALNGWILSGTYGWAPMHQLGHVLSARYGATHGATLAVIMLAWLRFWAKRKDNARYVQFAQRIFSQELPEAIETFEHYILDAGVQTRISQFGATAEDIPALTEDVVQVSFGTDGLLASVPPITREDVQEIYTLAL